MVLRIDTKSKDVITVALKRSSDKTSEEGSFVDQLSEENEYGSQVLLPLITKILKKNKLEFKDLKGIEVETGPGSFTGLKVGVSVANALGFALNIPVNGKKMETEIKYS